MAELAADIEGRIGASGKARIYFDAIDATGNYPVEIRVTSVNGKSVDCAATEGTAEIYAFLPVNRPLVEEYTGLWCGFCPRGYMALEMMKELKGNLFIAAAYHNGDPMSWDGKTPNYVSGFPAAYINRSTSVNLKGHPCHLDFPLHQGPYRSRLPRQLSPRGRQPQRPEMDTVKLFLGRHNRGIPLYGQ